MKTGCKWVAQTKLAGLLIFLLSACSATTQLETPRWQSTLYTDHELVGTIWDVENSRAIDANTLLQRLESARYLILGEKHDNPDHHSLQLAVMKYRLAEDDLSAISFEMMDSTVQSKLDRLGDQLFESDEQLKEYLQWDEEGWDWTFYGPLIRAAADSSLPLAAANISRETMTGVYGAETGPSFATIVGEEVMAQLMIDIDESHCGLLPESQFPAMVRVQQARDSAMANSLMAPDPGKASLLIAGNYHARHDLGVPNYLLASHSTLSRDDIVSLSFMEVSPDVVNPDDYVEATGGVQAYDYVWFTPGVSNEDYCASLRE